MKEWILPKVQEWEETIDTLGRFSASYLQTAYSGLAMSLQLKFQYLMRTVLGVRSYMVRMEEALENTFLLKVMGLYSIPWNLRKLLAPGSKKASLGIPKPAEVSDLINGTSLACIEFLAKSLIIGEALSTSENRACV